MNQGTLLRPCKLGPNLSEALDWRETADFAVNLRRGLTSQQGKESHEKTLPAQSLFVIKTLYLLEMKRKAKEMQ